MRVAGVLAIAVAATGVYAGTAAAAGPPVYTKYDVSGAMHVATANADVQIGKGTLELYTDVGPYTFYGHTTLPPSTVHQDITGIGTVDATLTYTPVDEISGSNFGTFTATESWQVTISGVAVNGTPVDVGDSCATAEPVSMTLAAPNGFDLSKGGELTSTFDIGQFANCATATDTINATVPGSGNTLDLTATAAS